MQAIPTKPLPIALAAKKPHTPTLQDYPALALAASDLNGQSRPLDTASAEFGGVLATLETLNRLKLGARNAHALAMLISRGAMRASDIGSAARLSPPGVSVLLRRLEGLALISTRRSLEGDGREVIATATQAGHNVMASIVVLSALGQAATVLFRKS